jgi:2-polyprenyl-3-methyl-5-hydroxy-6-metoxy-1,4-benzoquinol methylase
MKLSSIYDQRYSSGYRERLSGYEIARWKALDSLISQTLHLSDVKRVLDYGGGSGLHIGLWERLFPKADLHFCDISSVAKEKFQEKYPHYSGQYFMIDNDKAQCKDESYDVVVSIEVMEHVENLQLYIRDIHRVLKPGGIFVWTTPCANLFSIEHLYSLFMRQIEPTAEGYRRWKWEDSTHLRRLKSKEAETLLLQNKFSNIRFRFRAHFFSFVISRLPGKRGQKLRNFFMTLDYSLFRLLPNGASMIGFAQKASHTT